LVPRIQKNDFSDFPGLFTKQKSGNPEIVAGNPGISSETTRESRVRRPGNHSVPAAAKGRSQNPEVGSRSRKPEAESRKPEAGARGGFVS